MTGFTNSDNRSICSYYRDGKRQAPSSLPGARARDGRVIPQAQTGHIGRGEDMAPVDSDRPEHQGRPHPPATDQPGPRHRCDPSASTNDRLARHSTPNAASAPSHGGPLDTRLRARFSASQGRTWGRAAVVVEQGVIPPVARTARRATPPGGATVPAIRSRRSVGHSVIECGWGAGRRKRRPRCRA